MCIRDSLGIIWATWHLSSIFGFAFAAILIRFARVPAVSIETAYALNGIALGMICSAALVAFATRGKHPGWIGLLAIAILIFIGI